MAQGLESEPGAAATESGGLRRIPFGPAIEANIRDLAKWMSAVGWIYLVLSPLDLVNMFASKNPGGLFNFVLKIFLGVWCLQGAKAFRKVADTDEADQDYVVLGLSKLRSIFLLQSILVIVALVVIAAALLFGFMVAITHTRAG